MTPHSSPSLQRTTVMALMQFDSADRVVRGCTRADVSVQEAIRMTRAQALIDLQTVRARGAATVRDFEELRQTILCRAN